MSTRSLLAALRKPRITALATAAALVLGAALTAAPASAVPTCGTSEKRSGANGYSWDWKTKGCIERRAGYISVGGSVSRKLIEKPRGGSRNGHQGARVHSAQIVFTFHADHKLVAVKSCDITDRVNGDARGAVHHHSPTDPHSSGTYTCREQILVPAKSGVRYRTAAQLRVDYVRDGKGELVFPSANPSTIRG